MPIINLVYEAPENSHTIPTNGLLAYYPFEQDANDYSGNGNNATLTGCTFGTIGGLNGVRLQETYSNTPTNYITSPITYSNTPVTAICWGYATLFYDWTHLMGNTGTGDNVNNIRLRFAIANLSPAAYGVGFDVSYSMNTNEWVMFGMTIDGTDGEIYINGQPFYSFTAGTNNTSTGAWGWGHGKGWRYHPRVGWLRQSAIYNRALSDAEMLEYYLATS